MTDASNPARTTRIAPVKAKQSADRKRGK